MASMQFQQFQPQRNSFNSLAASSSQLFDSAIVPTVDELEPSISRDSLTSSSADSGAGSLSEDGNEWSMDEGNKNARRLALEHGLQLVKAQQKKPPELRKERPNRCVVCRRPANCCHFDVPSCLGCRSFFRRTVLFRRQYNCLKDGQCRLDQGEMCRSCRFDRCIVAGMNPQSIRANSQTELDAAIAFLEKRKEELLGKTANEIAKCELMAEGLAEKQLLDGLLYVDDKLLRIRFSETEISTDWYINRALHDILSDQQSVLAKAELLFSEQRRVPESIEQHMAKIANGNWHARNQNYLFVDCFLCFEMAKTMPFIRELPIEDQLSLIANNTMTAVVLNQSFYSIQMGSKDVMVFPNGYTPICFNPNTMIVPVKMKLFCQYLAPFNKVGLTREEFLLVRNIVLLETASANLSKEACTLLQSQLQKYSKALMLYERCRHGDFVGAQRFAELMFFTNSLRQIGQEHQSFLTFISTLFEKFNFLPHPEYMDNVTLGIVGRVRKREEPKNEFKSQKEMAEFIYSTF